MLTFLEYRVALGLIHLHHNILNGLVLLLHLTINNFQGRTSAAVRLSSACGETDLALDYLFPENLSLAAIRALSAKSRGQKFLVRWLDELNKIACYQ